MPKNVNDIQSAEWSISLKGAGEVEEGFSDINQCIQIITSTQKGTDPLRPSFGCDMWRFMDFPIQEAAPEMVREILDAIAIWETRIEVTSIVYDLLDEAVAFNIKWILQDNRQKGAADITLTFAPSRETEPAPVVVPPIEAPVLLGSYSYPDSTLNWNSFDAPIGVTFQIIRSINGGVFVQIGEVTTLTEYIDADAPKDSNLTYRVRALKGARVSAFSNEVSLQSIDSILSFSATDDSYIDLVGASEVVETISGQTKVYIPFDPISSITAFYADDALDPDLNAGIAGALNLDDRFTGLRDVRARNQNFGFVSGAWVRNEDVSIDVENSIISALRVSSIIDSIIVSNGGAVSDDGTNFTGSAGENHANRTLNIGTIELDLSAPENSILFQKITALEAVGWTITTVLTLCLKSLEVDTSGFNFVAGEIEKTRELVGLEFVEGSPVDVKLYDTEANAKAGGATGLLADGFAAFSAWVLNDTNYNAWTYGSPKGIRFEAPLSGFNKSILTYIAAPTVDRVCGQNSLSDYFSGKAKVYNESGYDEFDLSTITSNNQSFSVLISFDQILNNNFSEFFLLRDTLNRTRYYASIISNQIRWFANSDSNNSVPSDGVKRMTTFNTPIVGLAASARRARIIFTYDGSTKEMKIAIDGIRDNVISLDGDPIGTFAPDYIRIGDSERISDGVGAKRLSARVRRFEIVDFALTDEEIVQADAEGSLRAVAEASDLLLDVDYQKANGNAPSTFSGTPSYTNSGIGDNNYEDF